MNRADGGHRKFILVEMMDYAETITAERVKRVIDGYGQGKIKYSPSQAQNKMTHIRGSEDRSP